MAVAALAAAWLGSRAEAAEGTPHGALDLACSDCHTTEGWRPLRDPLEFQHADTGFRLILGHEGVACLSCHQSLDFAHVATACADCHADPHRGELGVGCEDCHAPASWDNRRPLFDIHSATLFPLTGLHASLDCAACHGEGPPFQYATTPVECFGCHAEEYRTSRLDHVGLGFPTECELCHTTMAWEMARFEGGFGFDHDVFFELIGGHRGLFCSDCHEAGFTGTPTDCFSCHRDDYDRTSDPDHRAAGFPTMCELCHTPISWEAADLDHDQFFRLTGAHVGLDCEECHENGVFAGTPRECVGCHRSDYNSTDDPDHRAAGFSTDCEECHTTSTWEGAVINHDELFRLTGAHRSLDCQECHAGGVFEGTPTECVGCHRADYNQTTDPDHQAAGFPTDCEQCHDTRTWEGAEFDHDSMFFPIFSGTHRAEWNDCSDCHRVPSNFGLFECINCHAHTREEMDDEHDDVPGYVYQSTACFECHPTGRE